MEQISFFLERYKELGLDSDLVKKLFIETVRKNLTTVLLPEDVNVRGDTVYVRAHPALKSELYIKRASLLSELSLVLGPTKISSVR